MLTISRHMNVAEILRLLPDAGPLLAQYGLSCFGCPANTVETLGDGCMGHGFSDEDVDDLVRDLNDMLRAQPSRPQSLTLTREAAVRLKDVLVAEKMTGGLEVRIDEAGGFCLEFAEKAQEDHKRFSHADVPEVTLFASPITLARIGGATIDFREGRFKLDVGEEAKGCACASGGECGCR